MNTMNDAGQNLLIDLPLLWAIFRRRLPLFFGAAIAVLAIVLLITFQMTPRYSARATIIIDSSQNEIADVSSILSGLGGDSAAVDTEVEIIKSRKIAEKVALELDLYNDEEFNGSLGEGSGIKSFIKSLMPGQFEQTVEKEIEEQLERERVVDAVMNRVKVEREGLTYVISIIFESVDQSKAAVIANAYADQYLNEQHDEKFEELRRFNERISLQIDRQREELRVSEEKVQQYRVENGLLDAEGISLTEQQVSDVYSQLTIKRAELAAKEARLNNVNSRLADGNSAATTTEVLASPVISELRARQADVGRRRVRSRKHVYGALHPSVVKVKNEQAEIRAQISSEVSRVVSSLRSDVNVARKEVGSLEGALSELRGELTGNNQALVGLRELEREASTDREVYESYLTRAKETAQLGDMTEADAKQGSTAAIPTNPSFPNKFLNLLLGAILGTGVGAMLIMLAEIFDNGIRTAEDIEKSLNTNMIAAIPTLDARVLQIKGEEALPETYLVERPLSAFAEAYRSVRSALMHGTSGRDRARVVALTSSLSGEGKTVSALALGRICAMSGDNVIVVDCDLRRRILSGNYEGIETGLVEVLTGNGALRDAIVQDDKTSLNILPVSAAPQEINDVFGSKGFDAMLARLKTKYDLVILDTAPVTAVAESRAVVSHADAVVLVVRWRKTSVRVAHSAMKILEKLPTPIIGALLTQVDTKAQTQYGYEGSSAYYDSHKKYYHD